MKRFWTPFLLLLAALSPGCGEAPEKEGPVVFAGQTMGTGYTLKVAHAEAGRRDMRLQIRDDVEGLLERINRQMSVYRRDSEISRFNESRETAWFPLSEDTAAVMETAIAVSRKTGGAFDVTVGPLVNLWGFGPEKAGKVFPDEEAVSRARKRTGFRKLSLRRHPPALRKRSPGVVCDLSGIAKGYAVDEIAAYFNRQGFSRYLVEIGGEIRARGVNERGLPWQVGIEMPDRSGRIQRIVTLREGAMATSGDYRRFFEKDGIRYAHAIDPRTGKPVRHALASVTVIHASCCYADAMATAIQVLGPEAGYQLALDENLAAYLIHRSPDGYAVRLTPRFESCLSSED
jgi:thiamine biosynthesis lipoprotein